MVGDTLTVYSLLPQPGRGNARDIVDAEKLALYEAGGIGRRVRGQLRLDRRGQAGGAGRSRCATRSPTRRSRALIGPDSSDAAMRAVPLLNAAGMLEVDAGRRLRRASRRPCAPASPSAGSPPGAARSRGWPATTLVQARALLAAAREAHGQARPRIAIEQEPGAVADGLVAALREARGAHWSATRRAPTPSIYAGEDADNAAGVADGAGRARRPARRWCCPTR